MPSGRPTSDRRAAVARTPSSVPSDCWRALALCPARPGRGNPHNHHRATALNFACGPCIRWTRYSLLILFLNSIAGLTFATAMAQEAVVAMPTVDELAAQLQHENASTRRKASDAILKADRNLQIAALPSLVTTLNKETDGQVRLSILETIARLGPDAETAVPVLLDVMKADPGSSRSEKSHQNYRAAIALAAIGAPAVDGLRELLLNSRESIRAEAAMSLGRIGPAASSATDELIALLDDMSPRVSQEAAIALGKLGQTTSEALLKKMENSLPVVQARVLESFSQMNQLVPAVRAAIVKATDHNDPIVRAAAIRSIEKCELSTEGLGEILLKGLQQTDESVRLAAVNVLIARKDLIRNNQSHFVDLLRSPDAGIAKHAAFVMAKLGQEAAPLLVDSLQSEVNHVEMIGDTLGGLGSRIQPWLVDQMSHSNPLARRTAARALGQVRPTNPSGIEILRRGLSDEDRLVQAACLASLGNLGPRAEIAQVTIREKLSDQSEEIRLLAIDVLFAISRNEQNLDDFMRLLDDPSEKVQLKAIQMLRAIGPIGRRAMLAIVNKLSVSNTEIKLAATEYLRSHGPFAAEALPSLIRMLDDVSPGIRLAAAKTISQLRAAAMPAFERLTAMLKDEDSGVRVAALLAMSATGADFAQLQPHLISAMLGDDAALQTESLRLIGRIGRPAAPFIPQIIALAEKEDKRRAVERVLRGFQRSGPLAESIPALIELVNHKENSVKKLAIEFLGLAGASARGAIPLLEKFKDDPDKSLQEVVMVALKKIQEG